MKNWPSLCLLAKIEGETVACVVSKAEVENSQLVAGETCYRGYIAMLAVNNTYRRSGIGTALVCRSIGSTRAMGCAESSGDGDDHTIAHLYMRSWASRATAALRYHILNGADVSIVPAPLAARTSLMTASAFRRRRRRPPPGERGACRISACCFDHRPRYGGRG